MPRVYRTGGRDGETRAEGWGDPEGRIQGAQRLHRQAGEGLQGHEEPSCKSEQGLGRGAESGGGGVLHGGRRSALQDGGRAIGGVR